MTSCLMASKYPIEHCRYVQSLYRRALRTSLDWYVFRSAWRQVALDIRERFEINRNVSSLIRLKHILEDTEDELQYFKHPQPYAYPTSPNGVLFERNAPPPLFDEDGNQIRNKPILEMKKNAQ